MRGWVTGSSLGRVQVKGKFTQCQAGGVDVDLTTSAIHTLIICAKRIEMRSCILTRAFYVYSKRGGGGTQCVRKLSKIPLLEAGVESSTLPVEMEHDSRLRTIAWGCCCSKPGGLPLSPPPALRAGGAQ